MRCKSVLNFQEFSVFGILLSFPFPQTAIHHKCILACFTSFEKDQKIVSPVTNMLININLKADFTISNAAQTLTPAFYLHKFIKSSWLRHLFPCLFLIGVFRMKEPDYYSHSFFSFFFEKYSLEGAKVFVQFVQLN